MARFCTDRWLQGFAPQQLAPLCFALATRKRLSVREALERGRWMGGLQHMEREEQLIQFIELWMKLQQVVLLPNALDSITWKLTADDKYSAKSAYEVQFLGMIFEPYLEQVWKTRANGKVQMFTWLFLKNSKWTVERLRARGLPHDDRCCLCD
jgi:hypothetical protein